MNGEEQNRLEIIHAELLKEEITQERRLARMEARQLLFFERDGVCDKREKRIGTVESAVVSLQVKIATWVGGGVVILFVLQVVAAILIQRLLT